MSSDCGAETKSPPSGPGAIEGGSGLDDQAHPLSTFVRGTLRFHFAAGAVVEREGTQADARAVLAIQKDERISEEIGWDALHWFNYQGSQLVFCSFDARADQNWPISASDRDRLSNAGHPDGVVASLVRYWQRQDRRTEPRYSIHAVVALHRFACGGEDEASWEAAARMLEGDRGASLAAEMYRSAVRHESTAARDEPRDGQKGNEASGRAAADEHPDSGRPESRTSDDLVSTAPTAPRDAPGHDRVADATDSRNGDANADTDADVEDGNE